MCHLDSKLDIYPLGMLVLVRRPTRTPSSTGNIESRGSTRSTTSSLGARDVPNIKVQHGPCTERPDFEVFRKKVPALQRMTSSALAYQAMPNGWRRSDFTKTQPPKSTVLLK
ncbi:unnamed protein product [Nesidiocoris tenuis]|uniref:Uncharacterized protein n=1 Tax=Nesidiocoris tenuis TaxID=355587 RepID=A0A6H5GWS0_9HEMI|nr:unnamed protein product [Nesidiocoris tenuis]